MPGARAAAVRGDVTITVALAYREYETWFLAAANSLRGVGGLPLEGALEVLRFLAPCDQPAQPRPIGACQDSAGSIPVPLVGVDAAEDDVVLQDGGCRHVCHNPTGSAAGSDSRQTDDST